jgi:hypothetical protein
MELYKVTLPFLKKKFYESKKSFDQHWQNNLRYSKYGDVVAYKVDWKEQEWKCIRRVGPIVNYHSE